MQPQSELISLPQTLTEMFTKGRPEHERAVRGIRWGDGPIHVVADAGVMPAALVVQCAIEDLLDRPVLAREAASFLAYSAGTVRTGSPVIAFSGEGESSELIEVVRIVKGRGGQVLAVAARASAVAQAAHQNVVLPEVGGAPAAGLARACLDHAVAGYIALLTARLLARAAPALDRLEKDWRELPGALEKIVSQFSNAVRSLAQELSKANRTFLAGAGLYHAAALRAADIPGFRGTVSLLPLDFARLRAGWLDAFRSGPGALFITGSRSRSKAQAVELAREAKRRGASVFAVTDANDRELVREAGLTLLLPDLGELAASILALALAGWVTREYAEMNHQVSSSADRT